MAFQKGQSGNPKGKRKGTKSRFTTLKAAFLSVFERLGGEDDLFAWVDGSARNKAMFYQWITRMLPADVAVKQSGEIKHQIEFIAEYGEDRNGNGNSDK